MIVHPNFRRRGIGAALMRLALDFLNRQHVECIKLDATPAGRPLYASLGFKQEADFERWQGVPNYRPTSDPTSLINESLDDVLVLDRAAFGADRSQLLEHLVTESLYGPLVVRSARGVPEGYAFAREGRTATYIGPVVGNTTAATKKLLHGMLGRLQGTSVCLDVHTKANIDANALAERGLSKQRDLTRMRCGVDSAAETPPSLCASAGPELG